MARCPVWGGKRAWADVVVDKGVHDMNARTPIIALRLISTMKNRAVWLSTT